MPEQPRYDRRLIRKYLDKKTKHRRLDPTNAKRYEAVIMRMLRPLLEAGMNSTPTKMGEPEIEYLLEYYRELDPDTGRWMFSILNGWLQFYGNKVYEQMMVTWPSETRTNVDWLSPEEAIRMLEAAQGVERIVIHMELRLWMRRIEVQRLTSEDIQELMMALDTLDPEAGTIDGVIQVHGKGRGGGKWRTLAFAPETKEEVVYYQSLRDEMIAAARHHHENSWKKGKRKKPAEPFQEPKQWLIYQRGKQACGYGRTAIDNIVKRVAKRASITRPIGNHTLRRTGARLAYFAGVKLVEIMAGLGHKSEKETIRYLGLTVAELGKAQRKVYDYLQMVRSRMALKDGEVLVTDKKMPNAADWRVAR